MSLFDVLLTSALHFDNVIGQADNKKTFDLNRYIVFYPEEKVQLATSLHKHEGSMIWLEGA